MKSFQYHMIGNRNLLRSSLAEIAAEVEKAGIDFFQLREKDLSPRELFFLAREIRPMLRQTLLIVNGSLAAAIASKADGIHLQDSNVPVSAVRSRYRKLLIGYSAHSFEDMKDAESQGADYVFVSPVFQPISKSTYFAPHGISAVASWTKQLKVPVFALGGISSENLQEVMKSGCRGMAGISFFLNAGRFTSSRMVI